MKKDKIIVFACDKSSTGEGNLYQSIAILLKTKYSIYIYNDKIIDILCKTCFTKDRVLPFYILVVIFFFLLMRKNVLLVNYVPVWNPLIFILTRFGLKIGPVTGNYNILCFNKRQRIKNYLIVILSRISIKFINKKKFYWVSTKNVESFLRNNNVICEQAFPFIGLNLNYKNINDNNFFDIFIYTRYHLNRNNDVLKILIDQICEKYKIIQIGNGISNSKIKTIKSCSNEIFDLYLESSKCYLTFSSEDAGLTAYKALLMNKKIIGLKGTAIEQFTDYLITLDNNQLEQFEFYFKSGEKKSSKISNLNDNYNLASSKWMKNLMS